ncbi:hypothetical protein C8J55DRAFT_557563 [Lentinula edodes]|uniref:Secreted protein n=1 Tax=Lentinula lateritia TaxID=40482 RepID=A0A9W9AVX5_9AGAR|nr:hypothetical protein C8J55DRAFT_557563 [Lentinula edodes]
MRLVAALHLVYLSIGLLSVACAMPLSASNTLESHTANQPVVSAQLRELPLNYIEPQMPYKLNVSFVFGKSDGEDEREPGKPWKMRDVVRSFLNQPQTRGGRPAGSLFNLAVNDIQWHNYYKVSRRSKHGFYIGVENKQDKGVCNPKCTFLLLKPHSEWQYGEFVDGVASVVSGFTNDYDTL